MANLSEDIQCAGSDTRPPMLDKTDFASWQQRIRLYCRGKENGVNILKSIDEGPFQMGTTRVIVAEGTEGSLNLGPERPRVYSDLSQDEKDRYNADIRATNIILQGLPKDIYSLINHYTDAKDIWDNVKMLLEGSELTKEDRESQLYDDFEHFCQNKGAAGYEGAQNRVGNANPGQARQVKCYNCNGVGHIARNCTQPKRPQNSEYVKDKMLLMQAQENGVVLDEDQSSVLMKPCPSYDSDSYLRTLYNHATLLVSHADYTSDSNMTPYDQYVKDNAVPVVQNNASTVPNDIKEQRFDEQIKNKCHVLVTPNHAPAVVRDGEETLELTKISRKKMHDKMKANECVDNKVNITPPNYSKENFLATFTPQKQLTPEQIFWSQDIVKMKAEALKEQNTRPIKALTVYPPNTPATLVPRVLPTKRERGFEQTKTCYLTEVIPFFKTLQEHFEGIQKALTKEVKEMSDAFDELEAELDQSIVDGNMMRLNEKPSY
ncbi:retrovirus-related pol polyprotein from transposon TNT 1-94 [Tanacetum coccineum]